MKYYKEFKQDHPETIGETDKEFDRANYTEWLEKRYEALTPIAVGQAKPEKVWECKVCGKPFGDNLSLYQHYDEEHN